MRPYLSIDIETTGLNKEKSEVLEVALIADDLFSAVGKLPQRSFQIDLKTIEYSETYALKMNQEIIADLCNPKVHKFSVEQAFKEILEFTLWLGPICYEWDLKNGLADWASRKVGFCGKNAHAFDIPILKNFFLRHGVDAKAVDHWMNHIDHRVMDVGSMYYPKFGVIPSLNDINKITGRAAVKHRALDDAFDVVYAVRHALEVPFEGKKA